MVKLEAVLHPEEAELVWTMLNHAAAQLARQPSAAARDASAEAKVAPSALPSLMPPCPAAPPAVPQFLVGIDICTTDDSAERGRRCANPPR